MNDEIPSGCGNYVAYVSGSLILVYSKSPSDDAYAYDLSEVIGKHRDANGYGRALSAPTVKLFQWELPLYEDCSKFAVYISDDRLNAIAIFELFQPKPIIIEADPSGVASIQWISGPEPDSGSYKNCTQLAVFLDSLLDVKVYSLLTTTVQFTIPKPFISDLIFHPTRRNIWSIVVTPYYAKTLMSRSVFKDESSIRPVILHFWTDGTTSKLLASLKMNFLPGADSRFFWSLSGKWLLVFDSSSSLSGYLLSVYNSLGLHNKPVKDLSAHTAIPTAKLVSAPTCLSQGEDLRWTPILATEANQDVVYMTTISDEMILHYKCFDVMTMLTLKIVNAPLSSGLIWSQTVNARGSVKYSKLRYIPVTPAENWILIHRKDNSVLLLAGSVLVALRLADKKIEVLFTIVATLAPVQARVVNESCYVVAFRDHIVVCNSTSIHILTSSDYQFRLIDVEETETTVNVRTLEDHPSGPRWAAISNISAFLASQSPQKTAPQNTAGPLLDDEDTTITRNSTEKIDEVTDTFHNRKRRKIN